MSTASREWLAIHLAADEGKQWVELTPDERKAYRLQALATSRGER